MQRISLFVPTPQYSALQALAKARDVKIAELIRRAIEELLKHAKE